MIVSFYFIAILLFIIIIIVSILINHPLLFIFTYFFFFFIYFGLPFRAIFLKSINKDKLLLFIKIYIKLLLLYILNYNNRELIF